MWFVLGANTVAEQSLFQTGWFLVGLTTQTLVVHMVRTRKLPFIQSCASWPVILTSILAIVTGFVLVLSPLRTVFEFTTLPLNYWLWFVLIILGYLITIEIAKRIYIKFTSDWV